MLAHIFAGERVHAHANISVKLAYADFMELFHGAGSSGPAVNKGDFTAKFALNMRYNHRYKCGDYIVWIYEHPDWPRFTWSTERICIQLADVRRSQGFLQGKVQALGFESGKIRLKELTDELVASWAIEGEKLNPAEVRSSFGRRLGIDTKESVRPSVETESAVEIALDANQKFNDPLSEQRLLGWHAALFPAGYSGVHRITAGSWRTKQADPMQVVSGPAGHEKIHYEAPSASGVESEMQSFLAWFNTESNVDPVLKAGIAHLWFVTIHPLADGNGRIGRMVADMALARADGTSDRFYSLSAQIEAEREDYYYQLERQQRSSPEITVWLEWFLGCFKRAIGRSEGALEKALFKARLWGEISRQPVNERQRLVINRMLEDDFKGHMNTSKYAKMAKCSADSALRDIQALKKRAILIRNPEGGRSTSYRLTDTVPG